MLKNGTHSSSAKSGGADTVQRQGNKRAAYADSESTLSMRATSKKQRNKRRRQNAAMKKQSAAMYASNGQGAASSSGEQTAGSQTPATPGQRKKKEKKADSGAVGAWCAARERPMPCSLRWPRRLWLLLLTILTRVHAHRASRQSSSQHRGCDR